GGGGSALRGARLQKEVDGRLLVRGKRVPRRTSPVTRILLAAATLFVSTTAFADTVEERYEKLWHKAIPNDLDLDRPKLGCICRDSAQRGVIKRTSTPFPGAVWAVPTFTPDGSLNSASSCSDFAILPK